jgi:hypothetical protein
MSRARSGLITRRPKRLARSTIPRAESGLGHSSYDSRNLTFLPSIRAGPPAPDVNWPQLKCPSSLFVAHRKRAIAGATFSAMQGFASLQIS